MDSSRGRSGNFDKQLRSRKHQNIRWNDFPKNLLALRAEAFLMLLWHPSWIKIGARFQCSWVKTISYKNLDNSFSVSSWKYRKFDQLCWRKNKHRDVKYGNPFWSLLDSFANHFPARPCYRHFYSYFEFINVHPYTHTYARARKTRKVNKAHRARPERPFVRPSRCKDILARVSKYKLPLPYTCMENTL